MSQFIPLGQKQQPFCLSRKKKTAARRGEALVRAPSYVAVCSDIRPTRPNCNTLVLST